MIFKKYQTKNQFIILDSYKVISTMNKPVRIINELMCSALVNNNHSIFENQTKINSTNLSTQNINAVLTSTYLNNKIII